MSSVAARCETRSALRIVAALLGCGTLASCGPAIIIGVVAGGGGGGGGSSSGADALAPAVFVAFPTANCFTDARTITVRGTSSDPAGVRTIRVNGTDATTTDGFATWSAIVALSTGPQQIVIESEDLNGNVNTSAAEMTVEAGVLSETSFDVVYDGTRDELIYLDLGLQAVFTIDPVTLEATLRSGAGKGSGPLLGFPIDVDHVPVPFTIFLLDLQLPLGPPAVFVIDGSSGDRTILSDVSHGIGPPDFVTPQDLVADPTHDRVLVLDRGLDAIIAVDMATGDRLELSGPNRGTGPVMANPRALALDANANVAFVTIARGAMTDIVFVVDLTSGDRNVISDADAGIGNGPPFDTIAGVVRDLPSARLLVLDESLDALFEVNTTNGDRAILSDDSRGSGPILDGPRSIALDAGRDRAFVTNNLASQVLVVDTTTGARTPFVYSDVGTGVKFGDANSVRFDPLGDRALVTDTLHDALIAVDVSTGARTVISDEFVGSGVSLLDPGSLALDVIGRCCYLTDFTVKAVIKVDLKDGARSVISGQGVGGGPNFDLLVAIALDVANGRAFVSDANTERILEVNLSNGDRRTISDAVTGGGPPLLQPQGIVYDDVGNRLIVLNAGADSVLSIDLATNTEGDRTIVSDVNRGSGPNFANPLQLVHDRVGGRIVLVDPILFGVKTVDLMTGDKSELSTRAHPGTKVFRPDAIDFGPDPHSAFVIEGISQSLLLVDLETGERVVVSH